MAKKRSILDRYTASQKYIVSRGKALTFPASPFKKELKNDEVYGAVIDMPMSPTVLSTLVCFVNGAANLYFNLGGEYVLTAVKKLQNLICQQLAKILYIFLLKAEYIKQKLRLMQFLRKLKARKNCIIIIRE